MTCTQYKACFGCTLPCCQQYCSYNSMRMLCNHAPYTMHLPHTHLCKIELLLGLERLPACCTKSSDLLLHATVFAQKACKQGIGCNTNATKQCTAASKFSIKVVSRFMMLAHDSQAFFLVLLYRDQRSQHSSTKHALAITDCHHQHQHRLSCHIKTLSMTSR